jgi:GxxExxY protein
MGNLILEKESYQIIGACIEVHKHLGPGFLEIVYKDAPEYELNDNKWLYEREKEYKVMYKNRVLKHKFFADFIVFDKVVLEVKHADAFTDEHISQVLNYLKVSGCRLGLLVNFGKKSLQHKRLIL